MARLRDLYYDPSAPLEKSRRRLRRAGLDPVALDHRAGVAAAHRDRAAGDGERPERGRCRPSPASASRRHPLPRAGEGGGKYGAHQPAARPAKTRARSRRACARRARGHGRIRRADECEHVACRAQSPRRHHRVAVALDRAHRQDVRSLRRARGLEAAGQEAAGQDLRARERRDAGGAADDAGDFEGRVQPAALKGGAFRGRFFAGMSARRPETILRRATCISCRVLFMKSTSPSSSIVSRPFVRPAMIVSFLATMQRSTSAISRSICLRPADMGWNVPEEASRHSTLHYRLKRAETAGFVPAVPIVPPKVRSRSSGYFLLALVPPMSPDEVDAAPVPAPLVVAPALLAAGGSPGLPATKLPVPCGPVFGVPPAVPCAKAGPAAMSPATTRAKVIFMISKSSNEGSGVPPKM